MTSDNPRPLYDDETRPDPEPGHDTVTERGTERGTDPATVSTGSTDPRTDPGTDPATGVQPVHPLDEERPERVVVTRQRRSMKAAHVTSVLLSLILTPVGLVALDFGYGRGWSRSIATLDNARVGDNAMIAIGIAAAAFLVVGALSRLSGLGPLLAGLVFGVLPTVGFLLAPVDTAQRLLDIADLYDGFMRGLIGGGSAAFPVIGGLLVGAGLLGRWRRRV